MYLNDGSNYPISSWKEIDGKQYYFDTSGYMLYNTTTIDGYNVGADGAWISPNTESLLTDSGFKNVTHKTLNNAKKVVLDTDEILGNALTLVGVNKV